MDQLVRDVVTGSVSGAIYALVAAGLVLTYTTTGIFNFGYAGIAFSAAYVFFELNSGLGWPAWIAAVVVMFVVCPLLGLLLNGLVFRGLARASQEAQIVASVGVLLALPALCVFVVGRGIDLLHWNIPRGTDIVLAPGIGPQPPRVFEPLDGVVITSDQLIVVGVAAACILGLFALLRFTRTGLRMRSVADRHELAALRGVNEAHTSRMAWVLGTALAGVAGVVGSPILRALDTGNYTLVVFIAMAAVVVGRFQSVAWALAGAVGIAVLSNVLYSHATFTNSIPGFNSGLPFLFLLGGLLTMSRRGVRIAGSIASEPPPPDYTADLPAWRRHLPKCVAVLLGLVWIFFVLDGYWLTQVTRGLVFALILLSFTLVTGIGGMVSLAQAAFVSGAALLAGALMTRYDVPWLVALVIAVAAAMVLGVLVAIPSLRLGGVALALATLALAFLSGQTLFQFDWIRNGQLGWTYSRPALGPVDLADDRTFAVLLLLTISVVTLMIRNLERSTTGREILAVRNAPAAAASIGVSPAATKLRIFALSAGVAGLGGVLLATMDLTVTSNSVSPLAGLLWLAGVVLLGVRRPSGAIAAGLMLTLFPAILGGFTLPFGILSWAGTRSSEIPTILFGLGAIGLARQPDGVFQDIAQRNFERRHRRSSPAEGLSLQPPPVTASHPGTDGVAAGSL